jgi:hypothetical protein
MSGKITCWCMFLVAGRSLLTAFVIVTVALLREARKEDHESTEDM